MKQVHNFFLLLSFVCATVTGFAQSAGNNFIPELVFQNPVLTSGAAGSDGAVYTFSNVATGIDATVKIKARSSDAVVLTSIDVADLGWMKAFQPQLGIAGNVPANQNWWMDFEMCFYKAGTTNKQKIKGFVVTAIDVDGDGVSIQEYVQMNKVKSVAYGPVNYLINATTDACSVLTDATSDDEKGVDKKAVGPVMNYSNIDTAGTPVMATFTYEDKTMISFRYGARSGAVISNAGERLNSLWFKAFQLTPPSTLPISFYSFNASYDKKNVQLIWKANTDGIAGNFVVERSTDGTNFTGIADVTALYGTVATYQYKDDNAYSSTGIVYYRILSKEKSGEVKYSAVKLVRLSKDAVASLTVYPNPVQQQANLTLPYSWQGKAITVNIYNAAGMQLQTVHVGSASQTEALDFSRLSKGIYVVKVRCESEEAEQRIIKN